MSDLTELERRLGLSFHDKSLLRQALAHRSYLNENPQLALTSNERLEFLGDAVLGFVVAQELYCRFPDMAEGRLTRLRAALVCQDGLARHAERLALGGFLLLGRGEDATGGRSKPTNLARVLEALIGAIFQDQSMEQAAKFILDILGPDIEEQHRCPPADYKSLLQEAMHAMKRATPAYRVVETAGPDHEKVFTAVVMEGQKALGSGAGRSKKRAEAEAARAALADIAARGEGGSQ